MEGAAECHRCNRCLSPFRELLAACRLQCDQILASKVALLTLKIAIKVVKAVFTKKVTVSKIAQKVATYLGCF